jgi:hypothetical protein
VADADFRIDLPAYVAKFQPYGEQGRLQPQLPHHRRLDERTMVFDSSTGLFLPRIYVEGAAKKSSKTLRMGQKANWWAMYHGPCEVNCWANDFDQSQGRVFATAAALCERNGFIKAGYCKVLSNEIRFKNGSVIRALASDYKGGAGSRATLNIFDELWGYTEERAERLFEEATPIPTAENAWILIGTTAGFVGESKLLERLYEQGLAGERIDDELPIYRHGRLYMYWDHVARCPWHTAEYLNEQRQSLRPSTYIRLWENRWVSAESAFVTADQYDACVDKTLTPLDADRDLSIYVGVDGGVKSDNAAVVAVAWEGRRLRVVTHRVWKPTKGQPLSLEHTIETFARELDAGFDVQTMQADPWQLLRSIATLRADGIPIEEHPFNASSTTQMTQSLYDAIVSGTVHVYPDDDLRNAVLNASVSESTKGMKLSKRTASRKIDAAVALALAVQAALTDGPANEMPLMYSTEPGSAWMDWKTRGMSTTEPDEDDEVIEATEEEMAQRPDRDQWQQLPRAERKRRHHAPARVEELAKRQGWLPEDAA